MPFGDAKQAAEPVVKEAEGGTSLMHMLLYVHVEPPGADPPR